MARTDKPSITGHPSLQYALLMVLGFFGIYMAMPIDFIPQTSLEWVDLGINLVILIPSSFVALVGGLFAVFCLVLPGRIDQNGWLTRLALRIVGLFGFKRQLLSTLLALTPYVFLKMALGHLFGRDD